MGCKFLKIGFSSIPKVLMITKKCSLKKGIGDYCFYTDRDKENCPMYSMSNKLKSSYKEFDKWLNMERLKKENLKRYENKIITGDEI